MEENIPVQGSVSEQRRNMPNLGAPIAKEGNFASRGDIIPTLTKLFKKKQVVALYGGSGTGKTHVAVEYAHRYPADCPGANVYWVNANSTEEFEASFARIAERLNLRPGNGNIFHAVGDRLRKETYLIVFDGLDSESSIPAMDLGSEKPFSALLPHTERASFLITSRSKPLARQLVGGKPKYSLEIQPLDREDASVILLGKVTRDADRLKDVERISEVFKGCAGGLAMAGAYLDCTGKDSRNRRAYLAQLEARPQGQTGPVRAWQMLREHVKSKHRETEDVLLLMSCLEVQCVPVELFERDQAQEYLPVLEHYGLVEPSQDRRLFTVTPMFRKCAQDGLFHDASQRADIETLTVDVIQKRFNNDKEVLLPCALAALKLECVSTSGKRAQAALMFFISQHHMGRGEFEKALQVLKACLAAREADANLPNKSALIKETVKAIQQAEAGLSKEKQQPDMAQSSSSAVVRAVDVEVDRVDDHFRRCIQEAQGKYNEGLALAKRDKFRKAEELYLSANSVLRSQMHHDDQNQTLMKFYLKILSCLASMYCSQGRFSDAAEIFGIVLPEQAAILGVDHADTLLTRNDYALVLQESGSFDAAAHELDEVHTLQIRKLGADNSESLRTECNLAWNYRLGGRTEEARVLYEDVLKRQKKVLRKGHPDIKATQDILDELKGQSQSGGREMECAGAVVQAV